MLQKLCESGRAFEAVSDLCEMSARRDPSLKRLADGERPVVNMRELSAEDAAEALLNDAVTPNLPEDGATATVNGEKKI